MTISPLAPVLDTRTLAVRFEGVSKRFDRHQAVRDLSLQIPAGSVYGLLGPNGAGKTTSIRMLMGILRPDEGQVSVLQGAPTEKLRERIGYLPEERGLYPTMRVIDNLEFFGTLRGLSPRDARREARQWMVRFDMAEYSERRLSELSKGNQQKVQFITAVLHEPELLVLDEPFSGLDPVNQDLLRRVILELAAQGRTIILSSHLMDEVERLVSRLVLLNQGRPLVEGRLDEIKRKHGSHAVTLSVTGDASFVESHPAARAVRRRGTELEVDLAADVEPSDFLAQVAPHVAVQSFAARAASLHSIFVRLVDTASPSGSPEVTPVAPEVDA